MWKWLILLWSALFMGAACDSSDSERLDNQENNAVSGAELHHNGDHGEGEGDDEESGEDTGNEDSGEDTGGCDDDSSDAPQCDEQAALLAFKNNVQPAIDKACYSCHAYNAGGLTMVKEEDDAAVVAQNRTNLLASAQSDSAEKLFLKISNQSSAGHKGGDQSDPEKGNLTLAKIEAWLAAEVGCN